jgi:PST family polysaccharide transporter
MKNKSERSSILRMPNQAKVVNEENRSTLQRVAHNVSWLVAEQLLRMGTGFLVGTWTARYLGVEQYGLLNYAIAFTSIFSPFVSLGLDQIVIKRLTQTPVERGKFLGTAFLLKVYGSMVVLCLVIGSSLIVNRTDHGLIYLTAVLAASGLFQGLDVIGLWFQSQIQSKYIAAARGGAYLIATILKASIIWVKAPLICFAYATVFEAVLLAINFVVLYQSTRNSKCTWYWNSNVAKSLLKESYPLLFSGFAVMIYLRIDQVMLKTLVGEQAVGIYSAATRISEIFYFIPTIVVSSVAPVIYAAKQDGSEQYHQQIQRVLQFMVLCAFLIIGLMSFFSEQIILVLFGQSYAAAGQVLSIHVWASIFVFLGSATSPWFVAEKLTHLSLRRTLIGAITNVLLNFYLIPRYSAVGAAVATVVSYSFSDVFSNAIHPKTRKLFLMQVQSLLFLKSSLLLRPLHR